MTIAENLSRVRARIEEACRRAGRAPDEVTLVGVTKTVSVDAVAEAYEAGLRDMGENRVQEAQSKIEALAARGVRPRWHLIGHLQTNKAKTAIGLFDILHSVDSLRLARTLSRQTGEQVPVLLEVNVAQEASKFGFAPDDLPRAFSDIAALPNIEVRGLMTVAPQSDHPERARAVFRRLREFGDALGLAELSMGMTDDFEVAIEEGATVVRVGRAIFGPRQS